MCVSPSLCVALSHLRARALWAHVPSVALLGWGKIEKKKDRPTEAGSHTRCATHARAIAIRNSAIGTPASVWPGWHNVECRSLRGMCLLPPAFLRRPWSICPKVLWRYQPGPQIESPQWFPFWQWGPIIWAPATRLPRRLYQRPGGIEAEKIVVMESEVRSKLNGRNRPSTKGPMNPMKS